MYNNRKCPKCLFFDINIVYSSGDASCDSGSGNHLYKHKEREAYFKSLSGMLMHKSSTTYKSVDYPCDKCDHKATKQSHLKTNKQTKHGDIKYNRKQV